MTPAIDLIQLIQSCAPNVAPVTLAKIIRVESTNRMYAIGYKITKNGETYTLTQQPSNAQEAISWSRYLYANGYQFDAGPAQVRSTNFTRFGLTPDSVFEPCLNIHAAGVVLTEFYVRAIKKYGHGQRALVAAVYGYRTGRLGDGTEDISKVANADVYSYRPILISDGKINHNSNISIQATNQNKTYNQK